MYHPHFLSAMPCVQNGRHVVGCDELGLGDETLNMRFVASTCSLGGGLETVSAATCARAHGGMGNTGISELPNGSSAGGLYDASALGWGALSVMDGSLLSQSARWSARELTTWNMQSSVVSSRNPTSSRDASDGSRP
ncbi:Hypothetical protein, putative [Bodo saltans]|uniref:Uncharacterized protein n=1 Tax=Bodo saltans TaxID=75058 RepID=A0A0S4JB13_BODSA|nr:Hypothetical protein, putative [Bodo saltans]|eukprot:CUG87130.1 Hypothetical protein, putative [Bodo saltans]